MPLDLKDPRKGKTPFYSIRGTYLHVYVNQSCGTDKRPVAARMLRDLEGAIERGEYPPKEAAADREQPTFLTAAVAYLEAGRSPRYVATLIKHFGETLLHEIDQAAIDAAAAAICGHTSAGNRNASVYTPVSAILHHAGVATVMQADGQMANIRRPKGAKGRVVTDWLVPPDALGIIAAASFDSEFQLFLNDLLYTGQRPFCEVVVRQREDLRLEEGTAWTRRGKDGIASDIRLLDELCAGFAAHLATHDRRRVYRFHRGGHLNHMLVRAKLAYLGIPCPIRRPTGWKQPPNRLTWVNFKTFRHTWATWMRVYAGVDQIGLLATNNWRDPRSPARYAHAVARDEWNRVDLLPTSGKSVDRKRDVS